MEFARRRFVGGRVAQRAPKMHFDRRRFRHFFDTCPLFFFFTGAGRWCVIADRAKSLQTRLSDSSAPADRCQMLKFKCKVIHRCCCGMGIRHGLDSVLNCFPRVNKTTHTNEDNYSNDGRENDRPQLEIGTEKNKTKFARTRNELRRRQLSRQLKNFNKKKDCKLERKKIYWKDK